MSYQLLPFRYDFIFSFTETLRAVALLSDTICISPGACFILERLFKSTAPGLAEYDPCTLCFRAGSRCMKSSTSEISARIIQSILTGYADFRFAYSSKKKVRCTGIGVFFEIKSHQNKRQFPKYLSFLDQSYCLFPLHIQDTVAKIWVIHLDCISPFSFLVHFLSHRVARQYFKDIWILLQLR